MKKSYRVLAISIAILVQSSGRMADAPATVSYESKLTGWDFGAGVTASYTFGDAPIKSAQLDSGNVLRIDEDSSARVGFILEVHYLLNDIADAKKKEDLKSLPRVGRSDTPVRIKANSRTPHFTSGPMFTVELGENIVKTVGLGWVFALQRYDITIEGNNTYFTPLRPAFNIGLSVIVDPKVKTLADEFKPNMALPAGTAIRFKEEARLGIALVCSTRF